MALTGYKCWFWSGQHMRLLVAYIHVGFFFSIEPLSKTRSWLGVFHGDFISWVCSSCKEHKTSDKYKLKIFLPKVGFEPGTLRLRNRRTTHCAAKHDIHNRLEFKAFYRWYLPLPRGISRKVLCSVHNIIFVSLGRPIKTFADCKALTNVIHV